jgi:hypothetical protein
VTSKVYALIMLERTQKWVDFCVALNAISEADPMWKLPNNVITPDTDSVVILDAYRKLASHVKSPLHFQNKFTLIEGQSGIGKSIFAIFLMKRLMLTPGGSFLYSSPGGVVYGWNGFHAVVYRNFEVAPVSNPNTLWIINQVEHGPINELCRKVLISSTDPQHYKQFKSAAGGLLVNTFFPLPSNEEAEQVMAAHNIPQQERDNRLSTVGPILSRLDICRFQLSASKPA